MTAAPQKPVLKVAVEEWVPWTKVVTEANGALRIEGPMANLLDILSSVLNFDYEFVRPVDRVWGGPDANGSWNGLLGLLQRREVELAVGPFGVTNQRETVCDFSDAFYSENNAILMVRPTLQNDVAGFAKPFANEVWLLTLVSLVAMVVVMARVATAEANLYNTKNRNTLAKAAIWGLKAFTQEGSEWLPPHDAGRMLVTTWLLASLVFMSSYSGILTAMLTVPRVTIPIDSLADLVAQDDLPWRLEAGSMMFQYFQEADDGVRRSVFTRTSGTFQDCWAARQDIAEGRYAAICDRTTMKKAMSWDFSTSGRCHLYISRENVYSNVQIAMAFQINSTYRERSNRIIHAVKESGILNRWIGAQITNTSQCLRPPTADRSEAIAALSIESMGGCFLVLVGGLAAGTAAFFLETVIPRL
ncbi:glutamate receptor ionotropic, kainate 1-like [Portunus trituberculatus]|uniref:Glutamate receptor ionotropic, kainate 1 n=1 Tax=Portunus trituberculatus TaxID=210409 RepID=A0A5B7DRD8_PORTR|nr:glutamate receptor ionotropic, kainate 1-like [Portunus trituberculatus]MPC24171.1 Glutamate receptor ionotropic, kainate 1 [Portunus trituberculatus]